MQEVSDEVLDRLMARLAGSSYREVYPAKPYPSRKIRLTIPEFCRLAGCCEQTIIKYIKEGRVQAKKDKWGRWRILEDELLKWWATKKVRYG